MANDNHANYARIGFAVLLGLAAITATLIYLGGVRGRGAELLLETYSEKPVSGLSVGSAVNFRGVKVGEVRKISFVGTEYDVKGSDNQSIYILMAIKESLMGLDDGEDSELLVRELISQGIRATVTASGITGLSRIEIDFASDRVAPTPKISWKPVHPLIPPAPSLMDSFSDTATRVMNEIDKIDFDKFRDDFSASMSGVASAVSNANEMVVEVGRIVSDSRHKIGDLLDEAKGAASSLREFAGRVSDDPALLLRPPTPEPLAETAR